jgi:tight adherence protein B
MGARRITAAFAATAVAALLAAGGAGAAQNGLQIKTVDTSHFPKVAVTVRTPTPGRTPQFSVLENGQPALGLRVQSAGAAAALGLVVDTSNSMRGAKLAAATAAAERFVGSLQPGDALGVYGFGAAPYPKAPLPTDTTGATAALAALHTGGRSGTAIYGSVVMASQALAPQPAARHAIVLITDGASSNDTATLAQAVSAANAAHVTVYAVSIAGTPDAVASLQALTAPTGGAVVLAADTRALDAAYSVIASSLGSTFSFTFRSLTPAGRPIHLAVSAPGVAAATRTLTAPGRVEASGSGGGALVKLPTSPAGRAMVAGVAALFVLLGAIIVLSSKPGVAIGKRIAPYTEQKRKAAEIAGFGPAKISMLHQLYIATEKIVGSFNYWQKTTYRLEQADLPLRTAEVMYIQMGAALLFGTIGRFALGMGGFLTFIPLILGGVLPGLFVKFKARQRLNAFEAQLPETLITMAASLKAGHAFNSALASVVKEGAEPTSKELARVSQEIALGMPSEAALEAMARRMDSTNFGFVVMAVNIQRTVGGSLAEILDMVADTVRQRQQFSRKVKALTAQGRMSAYVLLAMPFLMGLAIFALNPGYMSILFTSMMGKVMIGVSLCMMAIGGAIIRKIVSFKG